MSEKEKKIVEKIKKAMPNLSEFDKGYFLGKVESLADEAEKKPKNIYFSMYSNYWKGKCENGS